MKARLTILLLLLTGCSLAAQTPEQIRADASLYWAEAPTDADALTVLSDRMAPEISFTVQDKVALMRSYRNVLRSRSKSLITPSLVLRYLPKSDVGLLFAPRLEKAEEIIGSAAALLQKGEAGKALTYYRWAEVYLESLPGPMQSRLPDVRSALVQLSSVVPVPVRMPNVENEVSALRPLVAPAAPAPKMASPRQTPVQALAEPVPVRIPLSLCSPSAAPVHLLEKVPDAFSPERPETVPVLVPEHRPTLTVALLSDWAAPRSFGGTAAFHLGRWGGYLSARSDFLRIRPDYSCFSDGSLPDGGAVWLQQTRLQSLRSLSGGVLCQPGPAWLSLYIGAGYGQDVLYWQDLSDAYVEVSDLTYRGLLSETGLLVMLPVTERMGFCLKAGISSIGFQTVTPALGAGVHIHMK